MIQISESKWESNREFEVIFSSRARQQLLELYDYIESASYPTRAERYIAGLLASCNRLEILPHRGTRRDDILPGVRITHFRKRTVIAFVVLENRVEILGIFHGGRDYAAILRQRE
jgi:plasmid stabilization system protein ParE